MSPSIVLLIAYGTAAALSLALPSLETRWPRLAGAFQMLAALGLDVPRLLDGVQKVALGQPMARGSVASKASNPRGRR